MYLGATVSRNSGRFERALELVAKIEGAPDVATLNAWFADVAAEFGVKSFGATLLGRRGEPVTPIVAPHARGLCRRRRIRPP